MKGSLLFIGGPTADGGGFTNVTPSTDGEADGLAIAVGELVGEGLAGHALLFGPAWVKPWKAVVGDGLTLGLSGIGGGGVTAGLAVTVITILSNTRGPSARASVPNVSVAAVAVAALSTSVTIDARRRDPKFTWDARITG